MQKIRKSVKGFTLIELSVVLLIVSLLTASILQFISDAANKKATLETERQLKKIDRALLSHMNQFGYLPCPAKRGIAIEDGEFGVSTDCSAAVVAEVVEVTSDDAVENIRIGDLPTRNLGLSDDYMFDAWGNRLTYAVVVNLAYDEEVFNDYQTDQDNGVIQILDSAGNQIPRAPETCTSNTNDTTCPIVSYVVLSHGSDGKGSYNRVGGLHSKPCASSDDSENCDFDDTIFVDAFLNDGDIPANYYDDILLWKEHALARREANLYNIANDCSSSDVLALASLQGWYDASDPSNVTGTTVTQWDDISTNDNHLTSVSGDEPDYTDTISQKINGLRTIEFEFTEKLESNDASFIGSFDGEDVAHSVFAVLSQTGGNDASIYELYQTAGVLHTSLLNTSGDNFNAVTKDDGTTEKTVSAGTASRDTFIYSEVVTNGTTVNTYKNGSIIINAGDVDTGSIIPTYVYIPGVSSNFAGLIGEFLIFDEALSDGDRQLVECYLSEKWGITVAVQ